MFKIKYYPFLILLILGCQKNTEEQITEIVNPEADKIDSFLKTKSIDANEVLDVQEINGDNRVERRLADRKTRAGNNLITCERKDVDLKQNFEDISVLNPKPGTIWPGAIVKIDKDLLENGIPNQVRIPIGKMTYSTDLPGAGASGVFELEEPTSSAYKVALDESLNQWNDIADKEGYTIASDALKKSTISYTSKQMALDFGVKASWATGNASGSFGLTSNSEKIVSTVFFKQGFYTVTINSPNKLNQFFAPTVSNQDIEDVFQGEVAPGYIQSVTYGRILIFRLEASRSETEADVKGALEYGTGVTGKVEAELEAKYKKILSESSISVIAIGGNSEAGAQAVNASTPEEFSKVIEGQNAVYSKSNPGVPVNYVVRYLRDGAQVKMGSSTTYRLESCSTKKGTRIVVNNKSNTIDPYIARVKISYTLDGKKKSATSIEFGTQGYAYFCVPAGSKDIDVIVQRKVKKIVIIPPSTKITWPQIGRYKATTPETKCYRLEGSSTFGGKMIGQKCSRKVPCD